MLFKNKEELLNVQNAQKGGCRNDMLSILEEAVTSVDPYATIKRSVILSKGILTIVDKKYKLSDYNKIYVIGTGKAAIPMVKAAVDILGDRAEGVVNALDGGQIGKIRMIKAGHPIPTEDGCSGSKQILEIAKNAGERDIVLCLISGGGSAMMPLTEGGITLADKMATTKVLLECGANIREINAVRKHISKIKGGKLAAAAYPATVISLILSDVIGDPLDSIASGPTAPDSTTFADVAAILKKYDIEQKIPSSVLAHIKKAANETPKEGDKVFAKVQNLIIGSTRTAALAAANKAKALGYNPFVLTTVIEGEAKDIGIALATIAKDILKYDAPIKKPAAIIAGGETTVTIRGKGFGGRNQELCLSAMRKLPANTVLASIGTDGIDGRSDAAGAIVDEQTIAAAKDKGLNIDDYLKNNDSNTFFKQTGGSLLMTGPTGTNVADITVMLIEK